MHKTNNYLNNRAQLANIAYANNFSLGSRDAHDTAQNIQYLFKKRTGWFSSPKPIKIDDLCKAYKELCPGMETHYPGVIDKIFNADIITLLGFPVDEHGMVHFK